MWRQEDNQNLHAVEKKKKSLTTFSGLLRKSSTVQLFHVRLMRFSGQKRTFTKAFHLAGFDEKSEFFCSVHAAKST